MSGFRRAEKGLLMSSNDIAVRVTNLSKCYEIYETPRDRLKQFIVPKLWRVLGKADKKYFREFWAIKDITFEIKKGETIGIIGRNGSGKSTLLQMICGTLTPTSGSVQISGRVAALLELGSGFNPEFTGRENVYLNASVLGLSKLEIDSRFNDIVEFADIGQFIEQPVKMYSSGMYVRLAFAVIAHVSADILVVDEALSVGDVFFQQKCLRFLRTFQKNGGTIVFVSHDTAAVVNLCDRAILLSNDKKTLIGNAEEIFRQYVEDIYAERSLPSDGKQNSDNIIVRVNPLCDVGNPEVLLEGSEQPGNMIRITPFRQEADSFGKRGAKIVDVWFENQQGTRVVVACGGERVNLIIKVAVLQAVEYPAFGFMLKDRLGQYVIAEGTDLSFRNHEIKLKEGDFAQARFSFLMPILFQGEYSLNVAFAEGLGDDHVQHHWVNDAMALHSLKSRLVHGICGLHDLKLDIQKFSGNMRRNQ